MSILQTITMIQNKYPLGPYRISFQNQGNAWCNHSLLLLFLLFLPMHTRASSLTSQLEEPGMDPANNKSMVIIMAIVAIMFLISGFLSLYSRQCAGHRTLVQARLDLAILTGNPTRRSQPESLGLNQETIDTFPTFLYSSVKGLKIGTCALACAVCLSEFQDEETLRLITKCNHVFHMSCIDVWLVSHSTCPVCRANLVPRQDNVVSPTLSIQISNYQEQQHSNDEEEENTTFVVGGGEHNSHNRNDAESSKNHLHLLHRSRTVNHVVIAPTQSRSTGLMCALLFPRSNSTGNSVQVGDDDFERFTLRLPVEFQSQVLKKSTLKRAKSCIVFSRMSSGTKGYRTRSAGGGGGMRSYFHYERLDGTTPFFPSNRNR